MNGSIFNQHGTPTAMIEHPNAMKTFPVDLDVPGQRQPLTNGIMVILT